MSQPVGRFSCGKCNHKWYPRNPNKPPAPMMPSDSLADLKTRIRVLGIAVEERARRLEMRLDFLEEGVEKLRGHVAMMQIIAGVQRDDDA